MDFNHIHKILSPQNLGECLEENWGLKSSQAGHQTKYDTSVAPKICRSTVRVPSVSKDSSVEDERERVKMVHLALQKNQIIGLKWQKFLGRNLSKQY